MALLADEDDSYDLDPVIIQRSSTNEPLFDDGGSDFQIHRPKDKKEKKFKLEEKRGSMRNLPWAKQKDGTLEKNKKSKHNRSKSGSRTPPDSPKSSRSEETKKLGKTSAAGQLQPSPNVKSHRKRYSQLGGMEESSDDEPSDGEESGYLLSNKPALDQDQPQHGNPWASAEEKTSSPKAQAQFPRLVLNRTDNQDMSHDPWWPKQVSPSRRATVQFPVLFGNKQTAQSEDASQATSPDKRFVPHDGRSSLSTVQNPMFAQMGGIPSPVRETQQQPHPLFFQSPFPPVTALPPPPQPLAPPPSQASQLTHAQSSQLQEPEEDPPVPMATPISNPSSEPDWSISEELQEKCLSQFTDLKPTGGLLQGDKARGFFVLSKLPNQELSAIWRLADINKDNALSEYEFCVAMKLVMMRRKGCEIPSSLPQVLLPSAIPSSFSDNFWSTTQPASSTQPAPPPSSSDDQPQEELTEERVVSLEEDSVILQAESGSVMSPIDVEIEDTENSDTGLLVDISSDKPVSHAKPRAASLAPAVARIISLDEDGGEWEEHTDDTALVVKKHRKTGSEGSINERDIPREKPVRPAPPIPRVQRSKTVKATGSNRVEVQRSSRVTTPPPDLKSATQSEGVIISIDKGTPQATRKGHKQASSSKRDYTTLDSSPDTSPIEPHPPDSTVGADDNKGFKWNPFNDNAQPGLEMSVIEAASRGHARGKSLDLNKMIQADMTADVLDDLPSAVPPKPPPKPHHSPPAEPARKEGNNWPFKDSQSGNEEEGQGKKGGRVRSLSTGSINKPMSPEQVEVELETNALLLSDQPKPRPRKLKVAPRRPPPPMKPTMPDLRNYQVPETKGKTPTEEKPTALKDKKELQSSIRFLKEQNLTLTEVNHSLETKLFKLMEERVKLERELDTAQAQ